MCAVRGRPGGGPIDRIPPDIVAVFPQSDSTNITDLDKIEIYFSERMAEPSVEQALFISPTLNYEIDWSGGDELRLRLNDTLIKDRTYVITIGSGAMDSRKNKLKESFQFAFSSGDKIDRGRISGKVFGIKEQDNFYIYAYQRSNTDSLNPTQTKADFLSQPGEDGSFMLNYLSYGGYRIFVIEDVNNNLILDTSFERLGIAHTDVYIDSVNNMVKNLNFRITRVDTIPPSITGARAIDNQKVLLRMSEPVKNLRSDMIIITDTLYQDTLRMLGWTESKDEVGQYFIFTANQLPGQSYRVLLSNLSDTLGNFQPQSQFADFVGSDQRDTSRFEITKVAPKDSAKNLPLTVTIEVHCSLPIDTVSLLNSFICITGDNDTLIGKWKWENLRQGYFQPYSKFQPGRQYTYQLNTGSLFTLWGDTLQDTTISNTFFIMSEEEFGSLSGQFIIQKPLTHNVYIDILPLSKGFPAQRVMIDENNLFSIDWLPEGQYQIGAFLDLDSNKRYTPGRLFPFQFSEPFMVNEDTIRVRKRWEFSNITITIPGVN